MRENDIIDDFDFNDYRLPAWAEEGEMVAKFFSTMEAEIAAARLRSEGIVCFLAGGTGAQVTPHLQMIIRLHVRPLDAARAREILLEASIDTVQSEKATSGKFVLTALAVLIGLILAVFLVKAVLGN